MSCVSWLIFLDVYNFLSVTYPVLSAGFGRGSGPIHLDTMSCLGTEERLLDCRYDPNTSEDSHAEDAGVICFDGTCKYG